MTRRWRNWGRTEAVVPQRVAVPSSVDEVVEIVRRARTDGLRVKAVGAGHSFSGIAVAAGVQVDLSRLRGLRAVDVERGRVTLGAGTRLYELPELLGRHRLAMANLGDIDRQTIAGAVATGTHGTGATFGGISTQVVGATLVTGRGEVMTVDDAEPELLQAVALGLGALGILVEITLQCVPAFSIRAVECPEPIDRVVDRFTDDIAAHDHYEFYWFPHTDRAITKTNTRLPADAERSGPGVVRRYVDDELLSNKAFRVICGLGSAVPAVVAPMSRMATGLLTPRTFTDTSTKVFTSSRTVRFREMEYAIPIDDVPQALSQLRALIDRCGYRVSFPVEVRTAAADELMLSTASGRASGYLAVHRFHRDRPDGYFEEVERIMTALGGRPHWGKMHTRGADYLRTVYPRFDEFLDVRNKLDPDRLFHNRYLDTVLG